MMSGSGGGYFTEHETKPLMKTIKGYALNLWRFLLYLGFTNGISCTGKAQEDYCFTSSMAGQKIWSRVYQGAALRERIESIAFCLAARVS